MMPVPDFPPEFFEESSISVLCELVSKKLSKGSADPVGPFPVYLKDTINRARTLRGNKGPQDALQFG